MSTTSSSLPTFAGVPPIPVRRFSVDEYHRLGERGIFEEDDRVELLEGWIAPMMNRSPDHDTAIELIADSLRAALPTGWRVRIQMAITTIDSEPEPDLAVVRGSIRSHKGRHPKPGEAGLVIEVSDTSIERDRTIKQRVYARARVPVYWIVNLIDRCVEVFSQPTGPQKNPQYRRRQVYAERDTMPVLLQGKKIGAVLVADLLP